jgi:plasmid stabilization system protein ParE
MAFRVDISTKASSELRIIWKFLFEQNDAGEHGQKWMVGLRSAILPLADNARLYPTVVQRYKPQIETRQRRTARNRTRTGCFTRFVTTPLQ